MPTEKIKEEKKEETNEAINKILNEEIDSGIIAFWSNKKNGEWITTPLFFYIFFLS